jgi:hypothetical protein
MGLDTHMITGSRACSTSTRPTHPTVTNETSPHYAEALVHRLGAVAHELAPLSHSAFAAVQGLRGNLTSKGTPQRSENTAIVNHAPSVKPRRTPKL